MDEKQGITLRGDANLRLTEGTKLTPIDYEGGVEVEELGNFHIKAQELEKKVSDLEKSISALTNTVEALQSRINQKVDKDKIITSVNLSMEDERIQGDRVIIDHEALIVNAHHNAKG